MSEDDALAVALVSERRPTRPARLFRTDFFCIFTVYYCMQSCMCHVKCFFNSSAPKTRPTSVLRIRSRNTTRLIPPFTRTNGHNMPVTPEFLTARPNAWQSVSTPLSLIATHPGLCSVPRHSFWFDESWPHSPPFPRFSPPKSQIYRCDPALPTPRRRPLPGAGYEKMQK